MDFNNNVISTGRRSVYRIRAALTLSATILNQDRKPVQHQAQLLDPDGDDVRVYITGNVMEGSETVTQDNWRGVIKSAMQWMLPIHLLMTIDTAEEAYAKVLAHAGASLPRDAVDERIINDVINGTGK